MAAGEEHGLTGAEVMVVSGTTMLASAIVFAYLEDWSIKAISPRPILVSAIASAGAMFIWLRRGAVWSRQETMTLAGVVGGVLAVALWLAWPDLLPIGRGPDLTHHLLLIDYIDRHWAFVHGPEAEPFLGEMIHYTPGSHVLASLAGAWTARDGLHALLPVVAVTMALKAALVFLISLRLLSSDVPRIPVAVASVLLLFLPRVYFLGSFAGDSYFSQVASELFAVGMGWALTVWDQRPRVDAAFFYALAGAAAFLTWPIFIGPPLVTLAILVALKDELSVWRRLRFVLLAAGPAVTVAVMHSAGRLGWFFIVRTTAAVTAPSIAAVGWTFLILSTAGVALGVTVRRARATVLLLVAIFAQSLVLFVMAKGAGADTPYMARKMAYLAIYPLAVLAALALERAWMAGVRALGAARATERLAWGVVAVACAMLARSLAITQVPPPAISESAFLAGRWARAHVEPACVDYLVGDGDTSYWLHLAVLGNPRMSARTGDPDTFDRQKAVVRWIVPRGLPFAVTDNVSALPKDITTHVEVLARFGQAAVLKRLGEPVCAETRPPGS